MRRLLSLLLTLAALFAMSAALAQDVPGVEIIDVNRAKITGQGTFYLYADETVYDRLQRLADAGEPVDVSDVAGGEAPANEAEQARAEASSPYAEAALAVLGGLEGGLPADEVEASARYVLTERMGGSTDASILAFAAYAAAYTSKAVSAMAALEEGFPSVEAYTAEALRRGDVLAAARQSAYDAVYGGLYGAYLKSAVSAESAAEMAKTIAEPAAAAAADAFAGHVQSDAAFAARLDAYVAGATCRKFVLGTDEDGNPAGIVVANINRVFTRGSVTVVLLGVSVESAEAYETSTIIMLGGSVQKITTGHSASLLTEGAQVGRAFALNASTQAHTDSEVGAAFADPDASIHGFDGVQNEFYLLGPAGTRR